MEILSIFEGFIFASRNLVVFIHLRDGHTYFDHCVCPYVVYKLVFPIDYRLVSFFLFLVCSHFKDHHSFNV